MLRGLGLLAILAAVLAASPAAFADEGGENYSSRLKSVAPKVDGLTVHVVDGDDALELENETGKNVLVPGYENEPYLRFLADGRVEVNVNSPAKYLNEERYGGTTVPKSANAKAKPKWAVVARNGVYEWHEHRVHWMSTQRPPKVVASGGHELTKIFDWIVPLRVGSDAVKVSGTLWWVPSEEDEEAEAAAVDSAAAESDSGSPLLWIVIAVLGGALIGVIVYVVKLRRGDDPQRPAGEAW